MSALPTLRTMGKLDCLGVFSESSCISGNAVDHVRAIIYKSRSPIITVSLVTIVAIWVRMTLSAKWN